VTAAPFRFVDGLRSVSVTPDTVTAAVRVALVRLLAQAPVWSRCGRRDPAAPTSEERHMPTVIAYHDVKDTGHWLASSKREELLGPLGVTNIRTFVNPQQSTKVGLLMDVADMDALMGVLQSQDGADAMSHDGVVPETVVVLVERQSG
jgi:hypothetical protein